MITKQMAYATSDNVTFATLEAAQAHELALLFPDSEFPLALATVTIILKHRDKIVDVLTTGKNSKPRARKINKKKTADANL